jgi:hypothetical protein
MARIAGEPVLAERKGVPVAKAAREDHDPDQLFQILVRSRGKRPVDALDEIQTALNRDQLQIEYHIRGGAVNRSGQVAPPGGLKGPVLYQAWRRGTVYLAIEDDRLVVLVQGAIGGYAWEDTFFTVTNWFLVNELWPPNPTSAPTETPVLEAMEATREAPSKPKPKMRQRDWAPPNPTETPVLEALEATLEPPKPKPKTRQDWVKRRLSTKEARDELVREYDRLGEAVKALNREMENDPEVDAYAHPRSMESILRRMNLYPKGKPRLRK